MIRSCLDFALQESYASSAVLGHNIALKDLSYCLAAGMYRRHKVFYTTTTTTTAASAAAAAVAAATGTLLRRLLYGPTRISYIGENN